MSTPKITIGIPCYNAEETIGRAIQSALAQTWENIEILVVDDCSRDGSVELVNEFAAQHPQVRLIQHSRNTGPGGARATIANEASGEFIAFFDDDDESDPQRLKIQFERLVQYEKQPAGSPLACYASGKRIYPNGYVAYFDAIGSRPTIPEGEVVADYLLFNERVPGVFYGAGTPTCALMARKETILAVGNFDPAFRRVEDSDLAVRLAREGGHFIGCPERLYTQYATQASDKSAEANLKAELQLLDKHRDYLASKRRYDYARCWFQFRYLHFSGQRLAAASALLGCWAKHPYLVTRHFLRTAPRRLLHEWRMGR